MKPVEFYISVSVAAPCVVLSAFLFVLGGSAHSLQSDIQKLQAQYQSQQDQINAGITLSQQVAPNLFKDLSSFPEDVAIKALLAKHSSAPATNK